MDRPAGRSPSPAAVEKPAEGAALIVAAFFFIAVMSALGRVASGLSIATLTFSQTFLSWLLFLPAILKHGLAPLRTPHIGLYIMRSAAGLLSQILGFLAVQRLPLLEAVLLSNSAPLFIPLIARVWQKDRIEPIALLSLGAGFAGVVVILRPGPELLHNSAALLGIAAAFFSALGLVSVNVLSRTEAARNILFYYFLISSLLSVPFVFAGWSRPDGHQYIALGGIGLAMAASQLLIILAYRCASPARIAPFNFSVVAFSGLIGWLVWDQRPAATEYIGAALIGVGGAISTIWGGPNAQGHLLWLGHWNHLWHRRTKALV